MPASSLLKTLHLRSTKRLDFGNQFLKDNLEDMDIEKAIELVRTSTNLMALESYCS